jgi:hypothetical protein
MREESAGAETGSRFTSTNVLASLVQRPLATSVSLLALLRSWSCARSPPVQRQVLALLVQTCLLY